MKIISQKSIKNRKKWVESIQNLKGDFYENTEKIENVLNKEIKKSPTVILDHLRLCGNIPKSYKNDSTEEKLYSKYTDIILDKTYQKIGLKSVVLTQRAAADVEAIGKNFSFVADAKSFRLSRTAKNQKDFKVQAMDNWKYGKPFAMVVCPIYQLPSRNSQIYQQAITRNVCVLTYSHLSLLVRYANEVSKKKAEDIFTTIPLLNPSKSAVDYWLGVNKTILGHSKSIFELWQDEKLAATESIEIAKIEALKYLSFEREKIMRMSHEEALKELVKASKIDSKIEIINSITDNGLFDVK